MNKEYEAREVFGDDVEEGVGGERRGVGQLDGRARRALVTGGNGGIGLGIGAVIMGSQGRRAVAGGTADNGGVATAGYDDDGVKTQEWPLVREGILVGLQTNRETAHYVNEKTSRGCTSAAI